MRREAAVKANDAKRVAALGDMMMNELSRRACRNANYPLEMTLWQVANLECQLGSAIYDFLATRAQVNASENGADKRRREHRLVDDADSLVTIVTEMSELGISYAEGADRAVDAPGGAHFARLAARCFRACAMLYERGADMREYKKSRIRALASLADDVEYAVAANAGNLGNLYFNGRMNDERNYGVSYRDSRATESQRAMCVYFLEKGAQHGDYNAQHSLGKIIRSRGGEENIWRAIQLYKMGADNPNQVASIRVLPTRSGVHAPGIRA